MKKVAIDKAVNTTDNNLLKYVLLKIYVGCCTKCVSDLCCSQTFIFMAPIYVELCCKVGNATMLPVGFTYCASLFDILLLITGEEYPVFASWLFVCYTLLLC